MSEFKIQIEGFEDGAPIPSRFAFGKPDPATHLSLSDNINPAISWKSPPQGTKSFAIICHDPDVPSSGNDVNQEGKTVPADLPRVDFYHWVLVDIPATTSSIVEGQDASGVTPKGKVPGPKTHGVTGINSYTDWFAGDTEMAGNYGGYDGPCPPWNDSIIHHYHFTVYALNVESLDLSGPFTGADALAAISDKILAKASIMGTYSLNPSISG
ncbi:MAG: YbhB/YbcL family Raf kinase inhibitor-like protein [Pseudomonadota bacterium]